MFSSVVRMRSRVLDVSQTLLALPDLEGRLQEVAAEDGPERRHGHGFRTWPSYPEEANLPRCPQTGLPASTFLPSNQLRLKQ